MVSKLNLRGNNLIIYAIIYGFSQVSGNYYNGSLEYLCEWTNSTRQGVIKNLKELVDMGYINRYEASPCNIYSINKKVIDDVNSVTEDVNLVTSDVNLVNTNSKLSLHNNINNNNNNINKYTKEKELVNKIESIITYLNHICNTKFRAGTEATRKLIRKHINEGFTEDDFKAVIDSKYKEWGEKPKLFPNGMWSNEFLRPTTLFGDKFETYVYEARTRESSESSEGMFNSVSVEIDPKRSGVLF